MEILLNLWAIGGTAIDISYGQVYIFLLYYRPKDRAVMHLCCVRRKKSAITIKVMNKWELISVELGEFAQKMLVLQVKLWGKSETIKTQQMI